MQARARLLTSFALSCIVTLILAAAAGAASHGWLAPNRLEPAGVQADSPQVSLVAAQEPLFAWTEAGRLYAGVRPPGGGAVTARLVSGPDTTTVGASVATDPRSGSGAVAWTAVTSTDTPTGTTHTYEVDAVRVQDGGIAGDVVRLAPPGASQPGGVRAAMGPDGQAAIAWYRRVSGVKRIEVSLLRRGRFSDPIDVSGTTRDATHVALAIGTGGTVYLAWYESAGNGTNQPMLARIVDGVPQPPVALAPAASNQPTPSIAAGVQDDAVVAWAGTAGAHPVVTEAAAGPGRDVQAHQVSPTGDDARDPSIATAPDGTPWVAWTRHDPSGMQLVVANANAGPGAVTAVSDEVSSVAGAPDIAVDGHGRPVVAWSQLTSVGQASMVATRNDAAGGFVPVRLSAADETGVTPSLVTSGDDEAVVVWGTVPAAGADAAWWSAYDATGPSFMPELPTTVVQGLPARFTVSALDAWSSVGAIHWGFGDAATVSGPEVTHTFTASGHQQVSVEADDIFGNATSQTYPVDVLPVGTPVPARLLRVALVRHGKGSTARLQLRVVLDGSGGVRASVSRCAETRGHRRCQRVWRVVRQPLSAGTHTLTLGRMRGRAWRRARSVRVAATLLVGGRARGVTRSAVLRLPR